MFRKLHCKSNIVRKKKTVKNVIDASNAFQVKIFLIYLEIHINFSETDKKLHRMFRIFKNKQKKIQFKSCFFLF